MQPFNYLPKMDLPNLWNIISSGTWANLSQIIDSSSSLYERVGLDRLLTILMDMHYSFGRYDGFNVLDIGCNNGLFTVGMAACHNIVTGLDNFAIEDQNLYSNLKLPKIKGLDNLITWENQDIFDYLKEQDKKWDIVLLLSVLHHWEKGYAQTGLHVYSEEQIELIISKIFSSFKLAIYYECPVSEPGFPQGYGKDMLKKYLPNFLDFNITLIDETAGPNGYIRELLRIER